MLRSEATARTFIVILLAVLLGCCAGLAFVYTNSNHPASATEPMPKIGIGWAIPTGSVRYVTFSRDGQFACLIAANSIINCYSTALRPAGHSPAAGSGNGAKAAPSALCYSARVPGATRAVVAPGGEYTMAYSYLNPSSSRLVFLDARGAPHWQMNVVGAVWSADVCESREGARFVVGTGEKYVYIIDIDKKHQRYQRWRAPGAVVSVGLDESGHNVVFGTWQESGVWCATDDGKRMWHDEADSASLQFVETLDSSDRLLVRTLPNRTGVNGEFAYLDSTGEMIWNGIVDCSKRMKVLSSPDGLFTCLGYDDVIRHKKKSVREKHAALFDASGKKLWEKGSLFFDANPILVTNGGYVVVVSHGDSLFEVGPTGDPEPSITLPAPIKSAVASGDGAHVLACCGNGKSYLLNITQ